MKKMNPTFALNILAAAMMAVYGSAGAEESTDLADLIKPSSEFSLGVGYLSDDRQKLGMNDGLRDKGSYLLLDADINLRDEASGTWKKLYIRDLGLETREIRAEYLEQGKQGATFEYSRYKHYLPYTINTNQSGIGTPTQTTGTNIPNTALGSGANYQFGLSRDKLGVSVYKNFMPEVDLRVNFSNEQKEGNRMTSNGSALFVADMIEWTTKSFDTMLNYTGEKLQLAGGYNGSWFTNENATSYVALGATLMTQPLDNQAHQLYANGAYSFTNNTQANFKVAYTRATQNAPLPTAGISSNTYGNVPRLQGEVNTTMLQMGLSSKPTTKLGLTANLRHYDSHDNTPQYGTVRSTDNTADIVLNTTPFSYTTTSGKVEANYALTRGYNLVAGLDNSKQVRSTFTSINGVAYEAYVPSRSDLNETTYRLQLGKSLSETLNGSLAYLYGDRGGSNLTSSTREGTAFVSPVHIADRKRQKIRLAFDWAPADKLDFQLNLEKATDQYGTRDRYQGVHEGKADLYSIDANYQISENWQTTGWLSYSLTGTRLVNYIAASNNKMGQQEDVSSAVGINLTGSLGSKTKVGADVSYSRDKSNFDQSYSNGTTLYNVPEITSELTRIKLFANYAMQKNADLRFEVTHEYWRTDDWQWMYSSGLPWQYGTTTDGTTVFSEARQSSTWLSMRYKYKF